MSCILFVFLIESTFVRQFNEYCHCEQAQIAHLLLLLLPLNPSTLRNAQRSTEWPNPTMQKLNTTLIILTHTAMQILPGAESSGGESNFIYLFLVPCSFPYSQVDVHEGSGFTLWPIIISAADAHIFCSIQGPNHNPAKTLINAQSQKNATRFALDPSTTADAFSTEASLWTFDLDSVGRNGGFSLPPASVPRSHA